MFCKIMLSYYFVMCCYLVPTKMNIFDDNVVCMSMYVGTFVRPRVRHEMPPETNSKHRSTIFGGLTTVDEASSPANIHRNCQRSFRFIVLSVSLSENRIEYIGKFIHDYLANGER